MPSAQDRARVPVGPWATAAGLRQGCPLRPAHRPHVGPCPQTHCTSARFRGRSASSHEPGPRALQTRWTPCGRRSLTDAMGKRGRPISGCTLGPAEHSRHPTPPPFPGSRPGQARPPSGCHPPGQVPCLCSESGPGPHVPHPPRLTTMERVARQGQRPTGGVQVLVWPHGRRGRGAQPAALSGAGPSAHLLGGLQRDLPPSVSGRLQVLLGVARLQGPPILTRLCGWAVF